MAAVRMGAVDARTVAFGALAAWAVAVPAAVIVNLTQGDDLYGQESNLWVVAAILAVFVAPAAGGAVAARRRPARPLLHGAAAVLVASGTVIALRTVLLLARNEGVPWVTFLLYLQVTVSVGVLAAYVSATRGWRRRRRRATR